MTYLFAVYFYGLFCITDGTHHQRNDNKYTGLDPIQIGNGKYRSSSDLYETSDQMMGNGADGRTFNMPRILITEYGLLIENATLQDTGLYECALIDPSRRLIAYLYLLT